MLVYLGKKTIDLHVLKGVNATALILPWMGHRAGSEITTNKKGQRSQQFMMSINMVTMEDVSIMGGEIGSMVANDGGVRGQ